MNIEDKILERAKKSYFDAVVHVGQYKDLDIWLPYSTHPNGFCCGGGTFAVDKNGKILFYCNCEEETEILDYFYQFQWYRDLLNEIRKKYPNA